MTSKPSTSGISRSQMIISGLPFRASSIPALPPSAVMTSMWRGLSTAFSRRWLRGSSSISSTVAGNFRLRFASACKSWLIIICRS
jgi:hypothetical protein